ncbi:MAG TPA: WbqC family protein [Rhodocyclaceae bacterium]|nr:WbqC family protein [Rhodocyclaceae bacterium]
MILTAHQPVYLPWLGLFHKIALADLFICFDQVQYQPKDWNNRNRIKTAQGPLWLSVPVLRKGYLERTISDIEINNAEPWGRKHWRSMKIAYAKAPYFGRYAAFFEDVYGRRWERLVDLNAHMLHWFLDVLGIKVPVRSAGEWDFGGEKSGLVLDMCRQVGASGYIFGALGRDYADQAAFAAAGIGLHFQDYRHPSYPQLHGEFVSHLSIVDLLFNCGDESRDILLAGNVDRATLERTWR